MQDVTGVRVVAAAATVAALVSGARGIVGVLPFVWDVPRSVLLVGTVVAGVAAVVVVVAAVRVRDRRALAFGVSVLALALAWAAPGVLGTARYFVAQAALIAVGVLTVRSAHGVQRSLGWVVTVAAALWFVVGVLTQSVAPPSTSQEFLAVVYSIPGALQAIAFLAAAVLVAVPLLRTVGAGAGALWASAEVR